MENKKRENLLVIKNAIEKECEKHKLPLDTLHAIMECFNTLLEDEITYTFRNEVRKFYSNFKFISIRERNIDWAIRYNPFC